VSANTRLRLLAAVLALVAPASLSLFLGPASDAGSGAPATADQRVPAQRYLTALVNKKEVKKGHTVTIHGAIEAPDAPACAAGVALNVERSTKGAIYKLIGTVTTDAAGAYSVGEKVTKKSRFRISAAETDACAPSRSSRRTDRHPTGSVAREQIHALVSCRRT
jgi:hypothetical protein